MPKITIYENDNTGSIYTGDELVVFVPGTVAVTNDADNIAGATEDSNGFCLITELAKLPSSLKSNTYVETLLTEGLQVLYKKIDLSTTVEPDLEILRDKNEYNVKFLTVGSNPIIDGITYTAASGDTQASATANITLLEYLCEIAADRKDCAVIGSVDATSIPEATIKAALDEVTLSENCKYAGLFAAKVGYPTTAKAKASDIDLSKKLPDLAFLKQYAKSAKNNKQWDAIAGVNRGVVVGFDRSAVVSKFELDQNVITKDGYSFNGVANVRPYGATIWGDRTLFQNNAGTGLKASSFLSIRNMIADVCKVVYAASINNTYETNNEITWANFKAQIADLLDQMVANYNLAEYAIIKVPTTKKATIECKIHMVPIEPVEDFEIYIDLANADVQDNA